jgi:hypothetical protein
MRFQISFILGLYPKTTTLLVLLYQTTVVVQVVRLTRPVVPALSVLRLLLSRDRANAIITDQHLIVEDTEGRLR